MTLHEVVFTYLIVGELWVLGGLYLGDQLEREVRNWRTPHLSTWAFIGIWPYFMVPALWRKLWS